MSETETQTENEQDLYVTGVDKEQKTATIGPKEPTAEPIDPVLLDKLAALKSIVTIDKILTNCIVPGSLAGEILLSQEFLKKLHGPILNECQAHKDFNRATGKTTAADTDAIKKADEKRNRKMLREKAKASKKSKAN